MNEDKKIVIELTASNELPVIQNSKKDLYQGKKKSQKKKSIPTLMSLNESERVRKEFRKIYKQIKQKSQNSTANLIEIIKSENRFVDTNKQEEDLVKNGFHGERYEGNTFSQAMELMEFYPKRLEQKPVIISKLQKKLKPMNNSMYKRLETDYLNVEKIKIMKKRMKTERNMNYVLGIGNNIKIEQLCLENENQKQIHKKTFQPARVTFKQQQKYREKTQIKYYTSHKLEKKISTKQINKQQKQEKKPFLVPFITYYYRDLLWKVNFTNQLLIQTPLQYEHRLRAYIGKGNNASLIRWLVKRRIWFAITDRIEDANFVWTQLKVLPLYELQKSQSQSEIKEDKYDQMGIMTQEQKSRLKDYFEKYRILEQKSDEKFNSRFRIFCKKMKKIVKSKEIKEIKMHNHLINNYVIGNKKALLKAMTYHYQKINENVFNYLPTTFHIVEGLQDENYLKFLRFYYKRAKQIKSTNQKLENMWIVKPGENSNRGYGIKVCKTLQQIKRIIKDKNVHQRTYIVQLYIEKPLLYYRRKFDLRHYLMITCVNGILKGYWYRDGYVRTSSTQYSLKTKDSKVHLTNDAIQKRMMEYGKYEKGNKISYEQLQRYLLKTYGEKKYNFKDRILPKMKEIAKDVVKACSGSIDPEFKGNNFEIFGLDFMIDTDFNLWLIEVNTNPCLQISCPLLGGIIPKMIENALELTLDAMFPPPIRFSPKGIYYTKNLQEENKFDLIYDSRVSGIYESLGVIDAKLLEDQDETFEDDGEEWFED